MASLTGNAINTSYQGLIKTTDNGVVGATEKQLTDGEGNALPISAGTSGVSFTGDVDFTSATVTGLPSAAGLESGTGADSMQSAASLTTTPATALSQYDIAIGDGANAGRSDSTVDSNGVAIGREACTLGSNTAERAGVAIGYLAFSDDRGIGIGQQAKGCDCSVGIGYVAVAAGSLSVAIGCGASTTLSADVAIGCGAITCATGDGGKVAIGENAKSLHESAVSIGRNTCAGYQAVSLGRFSKALKGGTIAVGNLAYACGPAGQDNAISIGASSCANNGGAIALGAVANAFSLNSIAIGTSACIATTANQSVAIGGGTYVIGTADGSVAIGCESRVSSGLGAVAIGKDANASANAAIGIGWSACATACGAVALGFNLSASRAFTTASCQFESLEVGKGLVVTSPDGLTTLGIGIDNSGNIVTYTP